MSRRKAIGKDNIPAELFKRNEYEITVIFTEILNAIYQNNEELPKSWTEGVLCMLHKKNEKDICDNYRPITLINMSYKLLTIVLTRRIAPIMNLLTEETQTAYKQNRSTYDVLNIIKNITGHKYTNLTLTLMDLTKAFGKTNRELL